MERFSNFLLTIILKKNYRLAKMNELRNDIVKMNDFCKETYIHFRRFVENNDLNKRKEKIVQKNVVFLYYDFVWFFSKNAIKSQIAKISKKFENFKGLNLETKEYMQTIIMIKENFDDFKIKYHEVYIFLQYFLFFCWKVDEKIKKAKLFMREKPINMIQISNEHKLKIEAVMNRIEELKTNINSLNKIIKF